MNKTQLTDELSVYLRILHMTWLSFAERETVIRRINDICDQLDVIAGDER